MDNSDTSESLGAIAQIQYLHRKGRFAVPLRMKLLPSALRGATTSGDLSELYGHLQPLLRVDLKQISRGADLPADAPTHLHAFYRSLVLMRLSPDAGKADRADEVMQALFEEQPDRCANGGGLAEELANISWLNLYRSMNPGEHFDTEQARTLAAFLAKHEGEACDPYAVAAMTLLARQTEQPVVPIELLVDAAEAGLDYPQRWTLPLGDAFHCGVAANFPPDDQRKLLRSWMQLLLTSERESEGRRRVLESIFASIEQPSELFEIVNRLADVAQRTGTIGTEVLNALMKRGAAKAHGIMSCIWFEPDKVAGADAQFLIGSLLVAHDIAHQETFRQFCRRIAHIELAAGLKASVSDRVLAKTKMKQAMINLSWTTEHLRKQLKAAVDRNVQLLYLLLLAMKYFEGEQLGEASRALSLIDVAMRQNKIDPRHVTALLSDLRRDPRVGLATLIDEELIDEKSRTDQELFLLYMNLRVISQTSDRIEAIDLDNLSNTLRKLKIRDARGS